MSFSHKVPRFHRPRPPSAGCRPYRGQLKMSRKRWRGLRSTALSSSWQNATTSASEPPRPPATSSPSLAPHCRFSAWTDRSCIRWTSSSRSSPRSSSSQPPVPASRPNSGSLGSVYRPQTGAGPWASAPKTSRSTSKSTSPAPPTPPSHPPNSHYSAPSAASAAAASCFFSNSWTACFFGDSKKDGNTSFIYNLQIFKY